VLSYTWADIDPYAHAATTHRLAQLHSHHSLLLPPEAMEGWGPRLPMDAKTITPALFTKAFPVGVDLIMTSFPLLPQHLPRTHRGEGISAHATVGRIYCLIQHLAATQEGGIGFVWNTPVGSPLPAHVLNMTGP